MALKKYGSKIFEIIHLIYRDFSPKHFSVATFANHFIVRSPSTSYHKIHLLMTNLITTSLIFFKYFNIIIFRRKKFNLIHLSIILTMF